MERVYLHLASGGVEGRSPSLFADVLVVLRERGVDAHLVSVSKGVSSTGGDRMHAIVDDVPVYVDDRMVGNGVSCAVRFDASRIVPAYEPDLSRLLGKRGWPKTSDEAAFLLGRAIHLAPYTMRCVSEHAVADAVLTYTAIAKKMWPREEDNKDHHHHHDTL
jgi:hypothetical protein